jgi:uncharacterized repeat protein (TIGR03803 family)
MSNWKTICLACALWAATAIASPAQTFTTLFSFNETDGASPMAPLIQATNGNLYGSTTVGASGDGGNCFGGLGCGEVFEISPTGKLTTLYDFCAESNCDDGSYPVAGLTQATNGNFYGSTYYGGGGVSCGVGCGTVFELTPAGKLTTFYAFCAQEFCPDGANPSGGLVQATNQNFYGTASSWGPEGGTFFELTPAGTLTTLYNFCTATFCDDGSGPTGTLVQVSNGSLYGITASGGHFSGGVVYEITTAGKPNTVYAFGSKPHYADGLNPSGSLIQATDGNFYGTTSRGGAYSNCGHEEPGCGTVFKVTSAGKLTTLYSFCPQGNCVDGQAPNGGVIQATDGNFYGTTVAGGTNGYGTVFKITPAGTLTTLHSFDSTDGENPYGQLLQATNGKIYGTTSYGGPNGYGTVFSLSVGLGPFVATRPTAGAAGAKVVILGNNLAGTTSVTFNGTPTTFTVVSASEITATVPTGATTGPVVVTTPGGALTSNVRFRITN